MNWNDDWFTMVSNQVGVYSNPKIPHVPRSIEELKKQALHSFFVQSWTSNPVKVGLLRVCPVGPFIGHLGETGGIMLLIKDLG